MPTALFTRNLDSDLDESAIHPHNKMLQLMSESCHQAFTRETPYEKAKPHLLTCSQFAAAVISSDQESTTRHFPALAEEIKAGLAEGKPLKIFEEGDIIRKCGQLVRSTAKKRAKKGHAERTMLAPYKINQRDERFDPEKVIAVSLVYLYTVLSPCKTCARVIVDFINTCVNCKTFVLKYRDVYRDEDGIHVMIEELESLGWKMKIII